MNFCQHHVAVQSEALNVTTTVDLESLQERQMYHDNTHTGQEQLARALH